MRVIFGTDSLRAHRAELLLGDRDRVMLRSLSCDICQEHELLLPSSSMAENSAPVELKQVNGFSTRTKQRDDCLPEILDPEQHDSLLFPQYAADAAIAQSILARIC